MFTNPFLNSQHQEEDEEEEGRTSNHPQVENGGGGDRSSSGSKYCNATSPQLQNTTTSPPPDMDSRNTSNNTTTTTTLPTSSSFANTSRNGNISGMQSLCCTPSQSLNHPSFSPSRHNALPSLVEAHQLEGSAYMLSSNNTASGGGGLSSSSFGNSTALNRSVGGFVTGLRRNVSSTSTVTGGGGGDERGGRASSSGVGFNYRSRLSVSSSAGDGIALRRKLAQSNNAITTPSPSHQEQLTPRRRVSAEPRKNQSRLPSGKKSKSTSSPSPGRELKLVSSMPLRAVSRNDVLQYSPSPHTQHHHQSQPHHQLSILSRTQSIDPDNLNNPLDDNDDGTRNYDDDDNDGEYPLCSNAQLESGGSCSGRSIKAIRFLREDQQSEGNSFHRDCGASSGGGGGLVSIMRDGQRHPHLSGSGGSSDFSSRDGDDDDEDDGDDWGDGRGEHPTFAAIDDPLSTHDVISAMGAPLFIYGSSSSGAASPSSSVNGEMVRLRGNEGPLSVNSTSASGTISVMVDAEDSRDDSSSSFTIPVANSSSGGGVHIPTSDTVTMTTLVPVTTTAMKSPVFFLLPQEREGRRALSSSSSSLPPPPPQEVPTTKVPHNISTNMGTSLSSSDDEDEDNNIGSCALAARIMRAQSGCNSTSHNNSSINHNGLRQQVPMSPVSHPSGTPTAIGSLLEIQGQLGTSTTDSWQQVPTTTASLPTQFIPAVFGTTSPSSRSPRQSSSRHQVSHSSGGLSHHSCVLPTQVPNSILLVPESSASRSHSISYASPAMALQGSRTSVSREVSSHLQDELEDPLGVSLGSNLSSQQQRSITTTRQHQHHKSFSTSAAAVATGSASDATNFDLDVFLMSSTEKHLFGGSLSATTTIVHPPEMLTPLDGDHEGSSAPERREEQQQHEEETTVVVMPVKGHHDSLSTDPDDEEYEAKLKAHTNRMLEEGCDISDVEALKRRKRKLRRRIKIANTAWESNKKEAVVVVEHHTQNQQGEEEKHNQQQQHVSSSSTSDRPHRKSRTTIVE